MTGVPAVAAVVAAFVVTVTLTEPARRWAIRHGLTDRPASHKAHRRPTPYLGGVAIIVGTAAPAAVAAYHLHVPTLWLCLGAAMVVGGLGVADDARGLSARARLAVEVAVAAWLATHGVQWGIVGPQWSDVTLTVAWIVVITNSFNLLDNTDGALATVAAGTAVPLAVMSYRGGYPELGLLLLCLACACAGFLLHNSPPARIFMGDAGSLFIGCLLATGVLVVRPAGGGFAPVAIALLAAFVPIVDTTLVIIDRRRHGRSILHGGTDHAAHRLRRIGLTPYRVLGVLITAVAVPGLIGVLVSAGSLSGVVGLACVGVAAPVAIAVLLRIPGYPQPVEVPAPATHRPSMRDSRITS